MHLKIPLAVRRGENVHLICNYDLENDTLYSVKWYKGRREFYRYLPKENPAMKLFALPGITVDVSMRGRHSLGLKGKRFMVVTEQLRKLKYFSYISRSLACFRHPLFLSRLSNVCYSAREFSERLQRDEVVRTNYYI